MDVQTDFLVIGSGIAGLSCALELAKYGDVAIVTKKEKAESNTNYAQGGIAAVFSSDDSFAQHIQDTLKAGAGLCHKDAVELIVRDGPLRVQEIAALGANFTKSEDQQEFDLGREGGHTKNRIVHAKDHTGWEVERALLEAVKGNPNIHTYEDHMSVDLLTEHQLGLSSRQDTDQIHCWGAYVLNIPQNKVERFLARATILASGGCAQVYRHTTNPDIATGDGVAMAYRAGAQIANMEFFQFHPTTLYHPDAKSFLISEAVRGFGAELLTGDGKPFMYAYHSMGPLAPRDIVARAIDSELKKRGEKCVYLDITQKDPGKVRDRFPRIYENCLKYNIDITKEWIPVVPAAHYSCGGVVTDLQAKTSIAGLYACGEVTCTGVHGANRLASNSLLEAVVFAHQAAASAVQDAGAYKRDLPRVPQWDDSGTFNSEEWVLISHDKIEIRNLMWDYVGIVRSNLRLERAMSRVRLIRREVENYYRRTIVTEGLLELRNLSTVAQLIIESAMRRKESRGLHYTTDFPNQENVHWLHDTVLQRSIN